MPFFGFGKKKKQDAVPEDGGASQINKKRAAEQRKFVGSVHEESAPNRKSLVHVQLDPEVEANRAYLRSLLEPLSEFIKEYKNAAELNNNAVLKTPSLAVWAHSKSFLGNEPASRALHIGAARLDVVASTFCDVGAKPVRGTVKNLNAAEKAL